MKLVDGLLAALPLNRTFEGLMALLRPEALALVFGPRTPLSLFLLDTASTSFPGPWSRIYPPCCAPSAKAPTSARSAGMAYDW
jgi:hypothetical protein